MIYRDIEQGTEEWLILRLGIPTASRFKDVCAEGAGKTRAAYMINLAAERLTGAPQESYSSSYMGWGTETEPQARAMYEFESGNDVDQVTFIKSSELECGCSPDGLIGNDGLVEIKCPKTTTQIETYLSGEMPSIHKKQVQGQLWVSEREWCDFVSFDPRINGKSSFFKTRIYRDEKQITEIKTKVEKFLLELYDLLEKLKD